MSNHNLELEEDSTFDQMVEAGLESLNEYELAFHGNDDVSAFALMNDIIATESAYNKGAQRSALNDALLKVKMAISSHAKKQESILDYTDLIDQTDVSNISQSTSTGCKVSKEMFDIMINIYKELNEFLPSDLNKLDADRKKIVNLLDNRSEFDWSVFFGKALFTWIKTFGIILGTLGVSTLASLAIGPIGALIIPIGVLYAAVYEILGLIKAYKEAKGGTIDTLTNAKLDELFDICRSIIGNSKKAKKKNINITKDSSTDDIIDAVNSILSDLGGLMEKFTLVEKANKGGKTPLTFEDKKYIVTALKANKKLIQDTLGSNVKGIVDEFKLLTANMTLRNKQVKSISGKGSKILRKLGGKDVAVIDYSLNVDQAVATVMGNTFALMQDLKKY